MRVTVATSQNVERFTTGAMLTRAPAPFHTARATAGLDLVDRVEIQSSPSGEALAFLGCDSATTVSDRQSDAGSGNTRWMPR